MKHIILMITAVLMFAGHTAVFAATELCTGELINSSACDISPLSPDSFATWDPADWVSVSSDLLTTYQGSSEGLLLRSEYGTWYMGDNGALIAKGVAGNVAITTHVRTRSLAGDGPPTTAYSSAGLVLAVPGSEAVNNIMLNTGTQWNQTGILIGSTVNNFTEFNVQPGGQERWLRLCRVNQDIIALSSDNEGETWQAQQTWPRPDIPSHVLLGVATNGWNGPVDLEVDISHISYFTPVDNQDCQRSLNPLAPPPVDPPPVDPPAEPNPIVSYPFDDADELNDWSLLHEIEGRVALHTSLTIAAGRLSLQLINSGWWMNDVAPLIFRNIEGDFIVTSSVLADSLQTPGSAPASWYNSAGLMVRNGSETENWANLVVGTRSDPNQMTHTRTNASISASENWASALAVEMRVCRYNDELHWLSRASSEDAWVERNVESIAGWPTSLQVGMIATAWFGQTPDVNAQFEYVNISTSATQETCYAITDIEPEPPEEPVDPGTESPVVLMFVPYNDAWWAEYIVAYHALIAEGFAVDVRSDVSGVAATYGNAVDNTSNGSVGGNATDYATFLNYYNQTFGSEYPWQVGYNPISSIPVNGALQDVTDMDNYAGLYIVGGTGIEHYQIDGNYAASVPSLEAAASIASPETHTLTAETIETTALKLQNLVNQTLLANKPVAAICHAGLIMPYMRRTDIVAPGPDGLGESILSGAEITGFAIAGVPQDALDASFANLAVTFTPEERVIVSSPSWLQALQIHDKLITGSNWYPETVAYTAKTFANTIKSTPEASATPINVLVFGGNEPEHYAVPPLVHTDIANTLSSATGAWNFNVTATDNPDDVTAENLAAYDVLVYFQHNDLETEHENAIRDFVDNGGGLVGLHHAIYNHQGAFGGNDILVNLFGAELPGNVGLGNSEVAYTETDYPLFNVNLGHFITTYRVNRTGVLSEDRSQINAYALSHANIDNEASRGYYPVTIFGPDEVYAANHFFAVEFGEHINAINPLVISGAQLANGLPSDGAYLASGGWTRLYDNDGNGVVGRIAYLQPGETVIGTWSNPDYRQMFINSVVWAADNTTNVELAEPAPDPDQDINPIDADAAVQQLVSGYGFTEGVVWQAENQRVLFTDIENDSIYQLNPTDASVLLLRDSASPQHHANGLALDSTGNILIAEQSLQAIVRRNADGSEQVLADNWLGTNFNSPNDLVRHSNSTLYFTDPTYGNFFNPALSQALGFQAVYRLQNDGSLTQIANDFVQPNGIALSPDQSRLYVSDTSANHIRVFSMQADGALIAELNTETIAVVGNAGGLAIDTNGNIFIAVNEGVSVLRPDGSAWGTIPVPETVHNISFGGTDFKDLYIAAGNSIYHTRTAIAGLNILADDEAEGPLEAPPPPAPALTANAAARFLMQATFGPTLEEIEALTQSNYAEWIDAQIALPATYQLPQLQTSGLLTPKERLRISWNTPIYAPDQLRQRVALAFSEILVVSDIGILGTGSTTGAGMAYYNDVLVEHALGNYRDLLQDVILSPIMGVYLSMLNNERPNAELNIRADENLAREVKQLFSIGLEMLNTDGTPQLDAQGQVIATYGHEHIKGLARVFTGWTWADAAYWGDNPYPRAWDQPMSPLVEDGIQTFHDPDSKSIVGHDGITSSSLIPAGLSAEDELSLALDTIFNHPNVGPFICKALIQKLVTSNPSPAYVERVATLFNDNASGVRGDLATVVKAILLDEEARLGHLQQPHTFGKLREPMLRLLHLWRAFNALTTVNGQVAQFEYLTSNLSQGPYRAPSVFNFFQTDFRSPDIDNLAEPLPYVAPEFQINTESRLTHYQVLLSQFTHSGYVGAANPTFYNIAINLEAAVNALQLSDQDLLEYLDIMLMAGQMPAAMHSSLLNYMAGLSDLAGLTSSQRGLRAAHMIYLIMSSPHYLIQR